MIFDFALYTIRIEISLEGQIYASQINDSEYVHRFIEIVAEILFS